MAYSFMSWFNRVSLTIADSDLMNEFKFSSSQIGAIDSSLLLAYTLCMTPGGWLTDRFGSRLALLIMGAGSAIFVGLTGLAGHAVFVGGMAFVAFMVVRAMMGGLSAPIYPASGRTVGQWIPYSQRAWANGLITGAAPLGIAVAHVGFGFLVDKFTWRIAFVITGALTLLLAVIWGLYARNRPSQHRLVNEAELRRIESERLPPEDHFTVAAKPPSNIKERLPKYKSLVLLSLSYAAVGYFEYLFFFSTEYYFKGVLQFGVERSRTYTSIATLAMVVTMPLGGLFSDMLVERFGYRLGRAFMPVLGMLGSAATLFAATFTRDPIWTLLWFTLAHGAIGATEGAFWTTAIDLGGRKAATSGGIFNTGGNAGGVMAPYVTRWVGEYFGDWRLGFYLGSVICLVGVSLWAWIDPRERISEID
jgi:MFS family permease